MTVGTQLKLTEVLTRLAPEQIIEVLDFAEFLATRAQGVKQKVQKKERNRIIREMCGKYRSMLSSSEEVARRKLAEIALEERRWSL